MSAVFGGLSSRVYIGERRFDDDSLMVVNPVTLRVAFMVTLAGYRAVQGPNVADWVAAWHYLLRRLELEELTDEEISYRLSTATGHEFTVTTYAEPFELRKMQVQFTHADAAAPTDDVRVLTFHLAKITGAAVDPDWVTGDFTDAVTAMDNFWSGIKTLFSDKITYDRVKFYKAGPEIEPPQPPVYEVDKNVIGTGGTDSLPPQVAISVTEKAGTKLHWGRFYLPAPSKTLLGYYGRIQSSDLTTLADAADGMYQALLTAGTPAVVYRAPLPARTKKNGTALAARAGSAWTVEQIQVDDVFDVIRSRRWKYPTLRVQRDIA